MGNASYLTSGSNSGRGGLLDNIERLENTSIIFLHSMQAGDRRRASSVYDEAMACFDHIVNEFVRIRESKKRTNSFSGTNFEIELNKQAALMVSPVSRSDHYANSGIGPGNATLPTNLTPAQNINFEKLVVKLKHRLDEFSNFRIDQGRHIYVVCIEKIGGGPDCVIEFDVINFCRQALRAYQEI